MTLAPVATADAITAEIVRARLESAAEEMGIVLRRVSRSPLVSETRQYATGLFDGDARLVAAAPGDLVHLASLARAPAAALAKFSFDLQDGDVLIVNDPYAGGSTLANLTLVTVTMSGDDLVLFPASRLQLADIGGSQPGGLFPAAHELFQEGDIIPPVRLVSGGRMEKDILNRLLRNVRTPARYRADLEAMIAANRIARRRIEELITEMGAPAVRAVVDRILAYTERLVRSEVARWPDGTTVGLASCRDPRGGRSVVRATIRIDGDSLEVDFEGSSAQTASFVNSPLANTETFSLIAVLDALARPVPLNDGLLRSMRVIAPPGSVVNPAYPAATGGSTRHVGHEIARAVADALAAALPDRASVPVTSLPALMLNDQPGNGDRFISQLTIAPGGCPATHGRDGWGWPGPQSGIDVSCAEILESQLGLRLIERRLVADSGGPGRWRGGLGTQVTVAIERDDLLATAVAGEAEGTTGLARAEAGSRDAIAIVSGDEMVIADPVIYRRPLRRGDRVEVTKGGGSGLGSAVDRPVGPVLEDILDGYVSRDAARLAYGVELTAGSGPPAVDRAATDRLRDALRAPGHSRPHAGPDGQAVGSP